MENELPPEYPAREGDPSAAISDDIKELSKLVTNRKSIAGAASLYNGRCKAGDAYANNCAHFLSNAFIAAGYEELLPPNECVNARCNTNAKRVIRARDMWCWFKAMAVESTNNIPNNSGFWAVFQLDETEYWGGHVVIIDSNNNKYYGTGNYSSWKQYAYKW